VYIEPKDNPGKYDQEVFLTMKEFEPTFSRGGDMDMDFLSPATIVKTLKDSGESAMKASLAKGMPKGYEAFTINGRVLGHGEPVRVKRGERVLFHILNGSAGEIRSLALPGHTFSVIAMDGNPLPKLVRVPGLWLGTAERISAIVEMNHPGIWIMGELSDDDRHHGMGIVVEYAGYRGKALWIAPKPFKWNYASGQTHAPAQAPDEVFDMMFVKDNAAVEGFNKWTINGVAYTSDQMMATPSFHLREGKRYPKANHQPRPGKWSRYLLTRSGPSVVVSHQ
jgi:FtsP/CotA-like multicopper oxidase with cupredoxin domain